MDFSEWENLWTVFLKSQLEVIKRRFNDCLYGYYKGRRQFIRLARSMDFIIDQRGFGIKLILCQEI